MNQVKLIIWDLDDTFWKGTLSEGKIELIQDNIDIVKTMADRGIMNSIVSKNNFDDVKKVLEEINIWDFFIFPVISWEPKGELVKKILTNANLRAENTLFIDDNISNLKEVEFYNPKIMIQPPSFLESDFLSLDAFKGKDDGAHTRLSQYHQLEKRINSKETASSNVDFLKDSGITLKRCTDCIANIERIEELLQRTNQLNYTKNRMEKQELVQMLQEKETESCYIKVKDKYGDYGVVGFYMIKHNKLIHFVFSCRILGLGIENYLYHQLGFPELNVVGDVAYLLDKDKVIDWISEKEQDETENYTGGVLRNILLIGGCDLSQASFYLSGKCNVDTEFSTVIDGVEIRRSDTWQLLAAKYYTEQEKRKLCEHMAMFNYEITFGTKLYSSKYDCIVLSVVDDFIRAMFQDKKDKNIVFGYSNYTVYQQSLQENLIDSEQVQLNEHYEFIGKESVYQFEQNLNKIISSVSKNILVILINGCEVNSPETLTEESCMRQIEMNTVVDSVVSKFPNVELVDMRKIVYGLEDLVSPDDNRHYQRKVYYRMAETIVNIMQKNSNTALNVKKRINWIIVKEKIKRYKIFNVVRKILHIKRTKVGK